MNRVLLTFLVLAHAADASAQSQPSLVPQTGLHYYALENLRTGRIEQRGVAGSNGIAHDRLILAPDTAYRDWILQAATLYTGQVTIPATRNGRRLSIGPIVVGPSSFPDSDRDGLADDAERILGTDHRKGDSDGDGISDAAEARQGTNPLDGLPAHTGIIATADTPGTAVDVAALNDIVAVADSDRGVSVFNAFNGMSPVIIAQVDTPGDARRVALSDALVAVADGAAGLAVIDIADPPAARIVHQVNLGVPVQAVAAGGGVAYVGLSTGSLVVVDLQSGAMLDELRLAASVQDVNLVDDFVYALTNDTLYTIEPTDGGLEVVGQAASPFPSGFNRRLFVGGGLAYAVHGRGYNTFDLADPGQPALLAAGTTSQFGWKQIVLNGSGLGIAAVGPNQSLDGPHHVSLYDVSDPAQTNAFITTFETPGVARAVTLFNGLAYVADSAHGLQVTNFLAYDSNGVPPTITLTTDAISGLAEEGKVVRITADVSDDVQVRNVEFYVDGLKFATDGNFPFEQRVLAPLLAEQESVVLRARASDTGGNATYSDEITVTLVPDLTPPRVVRVVPPQSAVAGLETAVAAYFSEPVDPTTVTRSTLRLFKAGADGMPGTGDDVEVTGGTVAYRSELGAVILSLGGLMPGAYSARAGTGIVDNAGIMLTTERTWSFVVIDGPVPRTGFYTKAWASGGAAPVWSDPANWLPAGVPGAEDDVYVPPQTHLRLDGGNFIAVRNLFLDDSAGLDLEGRILTVAGDLAGMITGSGRVEMSGTGSTLSGSLPRLTVTGQIRIGGPTTVTGNVTVAAGRLDLNGQLLIVGGDFNVNEGGQLVMQQESGRLEVQGSVDFIAAGASDGLFTAGVLRMRGSLFRNASSPPNPLNSFAASGTHRVVLAGADTQVNMSQPGPGADQSHFQHLEIEAGARVNLRTEVAVNGNLAVADGATVEGSRLTLYNAGGTTGIAGHVAPQSVKLAGVDQALVGSLAAQTIEVTGSVRCTGAVTQSGHLTVDGGALDANGQAVSIDGDLRVIDGGRLIMQDTEALLDVQGVVDFLAAAAHDGLLTAGVLRMRGTLFRNASSPPNALNSFAASGTHRVVLAGADTQVNMSQPGSGNDRSHFQHLDIAPSALARFSNAAINGSLDVFGTMGASGTVDVLGDLTLRNGATLNNTGRVRYGGELIDQGATITGSPPVPLP